MKTIFMQDSTGVVFTTCNPEYHKDCVRLTQADGKAAYRNQCCKELRKLIKPGSTVYTVLRSVSSSGMTRCVGVMIAHKGAIRSITHLVAAATDHNVKAGFADGIVLTGAGMDMGWHLIYILGSRLWPKGTRKPHGTRNGEPDSDGGYAINHQWL
jgi:hypothetical protein